MKFPPLTPLVKRALIFFLGVYVAQLILEVWLRLPVTSWLALNGLDLSISTAWQIFSYPLINPDVLSFAVSMLFFWWITAGFEMQFGKKRTLQLIFLTIPICGVAAVAAGFVVQATGLNGQTILFGTHVCLYALMAAQAWSMRGRGTISPFGVITMKPEHLVVALVAISLLIFLANKSLVSLFADVAAIIVGILFIERLQKPRRAPKKKPRPSHMKVIQGGADDPPKWLN